MTTLADRTIIKNIFRDIFMKKLNLCTLLSLVMFSQSVFAAESSEEVDFVGIWQNDWNNEISIIKNEDKTYDISIYEPQGADTYDVCEASATYDPAKHHLNPKLKMLCTSYKINDDGNEDSETGSAEQERDFYLFINDDDNLVMRYNNCDSDCDSVFSRSEDEEDDGQDDASGENENCDDCDSADEGSEDSSKSK